jgi:CcmD family protein
MINKISLIRKAGILALLLLSTSSFAQNNAPVEMADTLLQSGKIYVVVTVLSVIFIGIITYLIMLDRKITKLEKEINNK